MKITKKSQFSGKVATMDLPVTQQDLDEWRITGKCAQNAFPNLSAGEREFLMTGCTPQEWDELFSSEDEEDE